MGIRCELQKMFDLTYELKLEGNLSEHEFDHVYAGISDDVPLPDPMEVSDWKFMDVGALENSLKEDPGQFTVWFKLIFEHINVAK